MTATETRASHTPGPWRASKIDPEDTHFEDVNILNGSGLAVAVAVHNGDISPDDPGRAHRPDAAAQRHRLRRAARVAGSQAPAPDCGVTLTQVQPEEKVPMSEATEKPVLVTTEYRGVFFGYASGDLSADVIDLKRARNCIHWPSGQGGFMGLASEGPAKGARIGSRADITLRKITAVAPVSPEAVEKWEAASVYRG